MVGVALAGCGAGTTTGTPGDANGGAAPPTATATIHAHIATGATTAARPPATDTHASTGTAGLTIRNGQVRTELRTFAACMRRHGINLAAQHTTKSNPDSYRTALGDCRSLLKALNAPAAGPHR